MNGLQTMVHHNISSFTYIPTLSSDDLCSVCTSEWTPSAVGTSNVYSCVGLYINTALMSGWQTQHETAKLKIIKSHSYSISTYHRWCKLNNTTSFSVKLADHKSELLEPMP